MNRYQQILGQLHGTHCRLVVVSKTRSADEIKCLYTQGQRVFGENRVQELLSKKDLLPNDIEWHLIGHLQSNKVKYIAPFISMIHSVDSLHLLFDINREAKKNERVIPVLIQMHIAKEETKYGADENELLEMLEYYCAENGSLQNIRIVGLMGMATLTHDVEIIRSEFQHLKKIFLSVKKSILLHKADFTELSMGMSSDYAIAIEEGSTMLRIGSLLFEDEQNSSTIQRLTDG